MPGGRSSSSRSHSRPSLALPRRRSWTGSSSASSGRPAASRTLCAPMPSWRRLTASGCRNGSSPVARSQRPSQSFAPEKRGDPWRDNRAALVGAMILDGVGEGPVPAAAMDLAQVALRNGAREELGNAAWRLLTRGDNPAFAKAAGAFLGGEETGAVSALFSTQNPAHEGTLEQFLQGDPPRDSTAVSRATRSWGCCASTRRRRGRPPSAS